MNPDPTSLDRLHDLVLPPVVSWWPPAPGWYLVFALALAAVVLLSWRAWKRWRANAYRRAALRELARLRDAPAIAELLRRTALAIAPRSVVAGKTGTVWTDWLAAQCPAAMSDAVRTQLTTGVYGRHAAPSDSSALRQYAALWIAQHRLVSIEDQRST